MSHIDMSGTNDKRPGGTGRSVEAQLTIGSLGSAAVISKPSTRQKVASLKPLLDRLTLAFCWRVGREGPGRINEPLTDDRVAAHVEGRERYGAAPMKPGNDTTRVALFDFDDHDGSGDPANMSSTVDAVMERLRGEGLRPVAFVSSGGRGMHIYILFENEQSAYAVRETLRGILADFGLKDGAKGLAAGEVEIFPKQDRVPHDGYGSMFVLPLAGKSRPLDPEYEWELSPDLPHIEPPPPRERVNIDEPELERVRSAVAAIRNEDLSYDEWRNIIFGIHDATDGSDQGLALAHEFSARSSKYDPDFLDNRFWPYVRSDRSGAVITATSLFLKAAAAGWQDPAIADAFDVLEPEAPAVGSRPRFVSELEYAKRAPQQWLVKGVVPRAKKGAIFGASKGGKSFVAADVLVAVSRGLPWRGHRTKKSRCGWIAAEDGGGMVNRTRAIHLHHGEPPPGCEIALLDDAPNFSKAKEIDDLIARVNDWGPMDVIVVDTLSVVSPGVDENSAGEMGVVLSHCDRLHAATGATIILIHHSGKSEGKGLRGSSSLGANLDFVLEVIRPDPNRPERVMIVDKVKNAPDGAQFGFKLVPVQVGVDEDGDPETSCVVDHTTAAPTVVRGVRPPRAGKNTALVLRTIQELTSIDGECPTPDTVAAEAATQMPFDKTPGKRDRRRELVFQAINNLTESGKVRVTNGALHIVAEEGTP